MKVFLYQIRMSLTLMVCLFLGICGSVHTSPLCITIHGTQFFRPGDPDYINEIDIVLKINVLLQGTYEDDNGVIQECNDFYYFDNRTGVQLLEDYVYADLIHLRTSYDVSEWHNFSLYEKDE